MGWYSKKKQPNNNNGNNNGGGGNNYNNGNNGGDFMGGLFGNLGQAFNRLSGASDNLAMLQAVAPAIQQQQQLRLARTQQLALSGLGLAGLAAPPLVPGTASVDAAQQNAQAAAAAARLGQPPPAPEDDDEAFDRRLNRNKSLKKMRTDIDTITTDVGDIRQSVSKAERNSEAILSKLDQWTPPKRRDDEEEAPATPRASRSSKGGSPSTSLDTPRAHMCEPGTRVRAKRPLGWYYIADGYTQEEPAKEVQEAFAASLRPSLRNSAYETITCERAEQFGVFMSVKHQKPCVLRTHGNPDAMSYLRRSPGLCACNLCVLRSRRSLRKYIHQEVCGNDQPVRILASKQKLHWPSLIHRRNPCDL